MSGALVGLAAVAWAGWVSLSLIDQVVLLGVAVVLPLSIGGRLLWWIVAASGVLASFLVPTGWAGLLVVPLGLATVGVVVTQAPAAVAAWRSRVDRLAAGARLLACVYAVVAAGALAQSRFGVTFLDIHEPIVELTAAHFMFAGAASLMLAVVALTQPALGTRGSGPQGLDLDVERAGAARTGRTASFRGWSRVAVAAVALTAVAPPVVATGFVTRSAIPQVGGAVLMTAGVWMTAVLHLRDAAANLRRHPIAGALLAVSGFTIWVPMALAVAWAAAHYWDVPAMSVPDMARTHGLANAFGFVLCGLVARRTGGPVLPTSHSQGTGGPGGPL